ncbi:MAG: hypothetical protein GWP45_13620, partial [Proteobacteria bacterium]|nr:hypothetical protein [Pseudomonadota bacterium]
MSVTEDAAQQTMIDQSLTAEEFHQSLHKFGREKDQSLAATDQLQSAMSLSSNAASKSSCVKFLIGLVILNQCLTTEDSDEPTLEENLEELLQFNTAATNQSCEKNDGLILESNDEDEIVLGSSHVQYISEPATDGCKIAENGTHIDESTVGHQLVNTNVVARVAHANTITRMAHVLNTTHVLATASMPDTTPSIHDSDTDQTVAQMVHANDATQMTRAFDTTHMPITTRMPDTTLLNSGDRNGHLGCRRAVSLRGGGDASQSSAAGVSLDDLEKSLRDEIPKLCDAIQGICMQSEWPTVEAMREQLKTLNEELKEEDTHDEVDANPTNLKRLLLLIFIAAVSSTDELKFAQDNMANTESAQDPTTTAGLAWMLGKARKMITGFTRVLLTHSDTLKTEHNKEYKKILKLTGKLKGALPTALYALRGFTIERTEGDAWSKVKPTIIQIAQAIRDWTRSPKIDVILEKFDARETDAGEKVAPAATSSDRPGNAGEARADATAVTIYNNTTQLGDALSASLGGANAHFEVNVEKGYYRCLREGCGVEYDAEQVDIQMPAPSLFDASDKRGYIVRCMTCDIVEIHVPQCDDVLPRTQPLPLLPCQY